MQKQTALKQFLFLSLTVCWLIVGISCKPHLNVAVDRPPNILFILTDDQEIASIDYMPKLNSLLIEQGVSFTNYFVNVSLCCPSRATTLRGQYAHNTGVTTNNRLDGGFELFHKRGLEKSTIATWLQAKGYRTAMFGKYLNNYPYGVGNNYVPPGWNEWASSVKGIPYSEFNYTLNENGKLVTYGDRPKDYGTDVYTRKARDFIRQATKDQQPFFVYLSFYTPHQPATPAPRHQKLFSDARSPHTPSYNEADVSDKPQYIRELPLLRQRQHNKINGLYRQQLRSLQAVDDAIGSLYNILKKTNQLNNTYIFFTSDNGFHLGQHRLEPGKATAYEEDIHVPLIVRSPGISAGKTIEQITGNTDLAPTFAELASAEVPDFVDGRSFASLLKTNSSSSPSWRQAFLIDRWITFDQLPLIVPKYHGIRTKNCTYVEYSTGERELYDLKTDPHQLQNLAQIAKAEIIEGFSQRVNELRKCAGDRCQVIENKPVPSCFDKGNV